MIELMDGDVIIDGDTVTYVRKYTSVLDTSCNYLEVNDFVLDYGDNEALRDADFHKVKAFMYQWQE